MIISTIILILFLLWYLNYTSKNDYFINPKQEDLELIKLLYKNYNRDFNYFLKAWNYFCLNPKEYNGSSIINDFFIINGLESESVEHDYAWIMAKSFKDFHISNLKYAKDLRQRNVNWFYAWGFIFCGLTIVSLLKSIKFIKL